MHITKMHGLGNSQILVEDLGENLEDKVGLSYSAIAQALCNPNFGVGSDQLLIIGSSDDADFQMRVFNRDGGEAEMCGNGVRCVAKYLHDNNEVGKNPSIETKAGTKELRIISGGGETAVKVDMGKGKLLEENKEVKGYEGSLVSVGNPHFVIFTDDASEELAKNEGPGLEKADEFRPEKANIEFAKSASGKEIETYVWERGAGLTLACGTGACAVAFAAKENDLVGSVARVKLPGGELKVRIDDENRISMKGPVEYVLEGEVSDVAGIYSNL